MQHLVNLFAVLILVNVAKLVVGFIVAWVWNHTITLLGVWPIEWWYIWVAIFLIEEAAVFHLISRD